MIIIDPKKRYIEMYLASVSERIVEIEEEISEFIDRSPGFSAVFYPDSAFMLPGWDFGTTLFEYMGTIEHLSKQYPRELFLLKIEAYDYEWFEYWKDGKYTFDPISPPDFNPESLKKP